MPLCNTVADYYHWDDDVVAVLYRIESALQQNEIMDVFFDDWAALTIDDGSFGSKADNHLKVPVYIRLNIIPSKIALKASFYR